MDNDALDQMLDDAFGTEESAEPESPESAAESETPDGEIEAEAADEGTDEADESDADEGDDESDPVAELRQKIEQLEAERAAEQAQQQALARQAEAAQAEAKLVQDERGWMAYFDQLDEQAWQQAQQTYNPAEAYRIAVKQIEQARQAKKDEYASYRANQYKSAYEASQLPYYAKYVTDHFGLDGMEAAKLAELATTPGVNPDSLPLFAQSLKALRDARVQEHRAAKAATLKKSAKKPGGGTPHVKRPTDLDSYLDSILG